MQGSTMVDVALLPTAASSEGNTARIASHETTRFANDFANTAMFKGGNSSLNQSKEDAPLPALEDSSMDTDSSLDVAGNGGSSKSTAAKAKGTTPGSPSASTGTDITDNKTASSSRRKSGAGMFSKTATARDHTESSANSGSDPVVAVVQKAPESSQKNHAASIVPRRNRNGASVLKNKKLRNMDRNPTTAEQEAPPSSQSVAAPAAPVPVPKARKSSQKTRKPFQKTRKPLPRTRKLAAAKADDDTCGSDGSESTAYSYEDDMVTGFFDGLLDMNLDRFDGETVDSVDSDEMSTGSADGGHRGGKRSKRGKNRALCDAPFKEIMSFLNPEQAERDNFEKVKPTSKAVRGKSKYPFAPGLGAKDGAAAADTDTSVKPGIGDFLDLSFFVELWDAIMSSKEEKATQKSNKEAAPVETTLREDKEADTLFDDLLDGPDIKCDASSFADLASRYSKSLREQTEMHLHELQSQMPEIYDRLAKEGARVNTTAEKVDTTLTTTPNTSVLVHESSEATPVKVKKNGDAERDWQPFFDSPFMEEKMEEPLLLKRLESLDTPELESEFYDSISVASPASTQIYPPSVADFESFEALDEKEELCVCGPTSTIFKMV